MTDTRPIGNEPSVLFWPVKEFCRLHGVGKTTVWDMIKTGELESVKIRGRRLIPVSASEKLCSQSQQKAA